MLRIDAGPVDTAVFRTRYGTVRPKALEISRSGASSIDVGIPIVKRSGPAFPPFYVK